ncbi:hypothetical protein G6F35_017585 [Rhizopus arrhizus]|nr:hypothetical protein G6F35_017585 [Rhizopus arrhizus]
MRQHATQPFGLRLDLALRAGQEAQGGQALRQEFRRAVQAQHGLKRGQPQLADAQGALARILLDLDRKSVGEGKRGDLGGRRVM